MTAMTATTATTATLATTATTAVTAMTAMTFGDTESRIRRLLVKGFNLDPHTLTADARLDELGVDSIGMAELIFDVEDEFGLKLPDVAVQLATFGEVVRFIDDVVAKQRTESAPSPLSHGEPIVA